MSDQKEFRWIAPNPAGWRDFMPTLAIVGGMTVVLSIGLLDSSTRGVALLAAVGLVLGASAFGFAAWVLVSKAWRSRSR